LQQLAGVRKHVRECKHRRRVPEHGGGGDLPLCLGISERHDSIRNLDENRDGVENSDQGL
jgi:hypothetical protein